MYYRKLQRVGKKTFSINLPREWVINAGIHKGENIEIRELDSGDLVISLPQTHVEKKPTIQEIITSDTLSRDITRAYLLGYEKIVIKTDNATGFTAEEMKEIELASRKYPGAEIMQEGKNKITFEIIASFEKMGPFKLIHYIFSTTQQMLDDIALILDPTTPKNGSSVEELLRIQGLDLKVNRTYLLIVRQLRALIQAPSLRNQQDLNSLRIMDYRLFVHLLEHIGDNCVLICEHLIEFQNLVNELLDKTYLENEEKDPIMEYLITVSQNVRDAHKRTFDVFVKTDYKRAPKLIQEFPRDLQKYIQEFKVHPRKAPLSIIMYRFYDILDMLVDILDLIQPEEGLLET
ncbi:MAG: phosphate uptake regulator PhoU [Candidatus Lokiarchaeota archaeon]|nr:phosphate uptake regulator PhoU [Candidatus Lokiarchaeota archaeon]